jgi:hypothetical protein
VRNGLPDERLAYGHIVCTVAHIDSRSVRMHHLQTWVFRLQPPREFLPGLSVSSQLLIRPHLCSPRWKMRIRFGPVTNGLRTLQRGQRAFTNEVLATRLVIANTGAMLTVGHEAPFHLSALACRTESSDHIGKGETSRQVSGTSS